MKLWFSEAELQEIQESMVPLPEPDKVFVESIKRFLLVPSTDELRSVLETRCLPIGARYDPHVHFNSEWAHGAVSNQLALFEALSLPLQASHLEGWYNSNVWAYILDRCVLDLEGMTLERGESTLRATCIRKNRNRTESGDRQKMGPRMDSIIRTVEDDPYEFGCIEAGRTYNSTKLLKDSFKLSKALRDMLYRLHEFVDHDAIAKKLQVVGALTSGLKFQLLRMYNPKGYISVLHREQSCEVPTKVQDLSKLLRILIYVYQMKTIVRNCAEEVKGRHAGKTETDVLNELLGVNGEQGECGRLGMTADTP